MSAPVNVLAVMDETIRKLEATIPTPMNRPGEARERIEHFVERLHELRQARAAVADLAEAARDIHENGYGTAANKRLADALAKFAKWESSNGQ